MAGGVDLPQRRVLEVPQRAVLADAVWIAVAGVEKQHRAGDALPQRRHVVVGDVVRAQRASVVVELPSVGAVLVLVAAVNGEVPRLFRRQVRIGLLHALVGVLHACVAAGRAGGKRSVGADPLAQPLVRRCRGPWIQPHPLDEHQPRHGFGKRAGEQRCDGTAQRVRHHVYRRQAALANQLGDVLHVLQNRIRAAARPLRVPVAAQIRRHDVKAAAQGLRQPIPRVAVVVNAMHQEQVGVVVVAPIQIVQAQPLREVAVRSRRRRALPGALEFAAQTRCRAPNLRHP